MPRRRIFIKMSVSPTAEKAPLLESPSKGMKRFNLVAASLVVAFAASASAQVVQYANRTLYNAATSNNTILTFTGQEQSLAPSISIGGVTFSGVGTIANSPVQVEIIDGTN